MVTVRKWTGRESRALREAMRVSQRDFADQLGMTARAIAKWEAGGREIVPRPDSQAILDTKFRQVSDEVRDRFHLFLGTEQNAVDRSAPSANPEKKIDVHAPINPLINRQAWTRDDLSELSADFDHAISRSDASDIEMLAHAWLSAENPQLIELSAGRRIGDALVSTAEHRVIQLRRADDYVSGRTTYELVREEIKATTRLLNDASLNESQARRLLTATGELAQLAAFVAADIGLYQKAESYIESGVIASHASGNLPLAANIISTLSYQLANTGKMRQAAILARTAYAGARQSASATTKALLLDRVAWADAKLGDINSCERSLGLVNDHFSQSDPGNDPDWVYWLSKEEIDVMAGRCFTELGQPEKAIPLLRTSIERYDDTHIREISLYQSWLAEDYVLLKDFGTAAALALEVLELGRLANSARTDERLRYLATSLQEYKSIRSVAEFLDRYQAYLQE